MRGRALEAVKLSGGAGEEARGAVLAVVAIPKPPAASLARDAFVGGGRGRVRARFALLAVHGFLPTVIARVQACSTTAKHRSQRRTDMTHESYAYCAPAAQS